MLAAERPYKMVKTKIQDNSKIHVQTNYYDIQKTNKNKIRLGNRSPKHLIHTKIHSLTHESKNNH